LWDSLVKSLGLFSECSLQLSKRNARSRGRALMWSSSFHARQMINDREVL
jgi:hypothetical protein